MLNTVAMPASFGGMSRAISVHAAESAPEIAVGLELAIAGLEVDDGFPDQILELNDVFAVPGATTSCLYDKEGVRIPESCVRRGERRDDYIGAATARIDVPADYVTMAKPLLYLSTYFRHWGHFVTESTSRLWPRHAHREFRDMDVFFAGFNLGFKRNKNVVDFLGRLSPTPSFAPSRGVARIAKCFVPAPSFVNRAAAHSGHLAAPRDVAAAAPGEAPRAATEQPVYLSRSRLVGVERVIANEAAFEDILRGGGVRIAHPQEMPLGDQIALFNTHTTILGCAGSALHNLMFARDGDRIRAHVFSESHLNRNCLLIDAIVGNTSHYVRVLRPRAARTAAGAAKTIEIDLEAAADYLRNAGIL